MLESEKWKVKVKSLSGVRPSATPWTAAYQAPPSMVFSRQEVHCIFTWLITLCSTRPPFLLFDLLISSLFWFLTLFNLISVVLSSPFSYTWGWFLCPDNSSLVDFIKKERGINILATTKTCHMAWLSIKGNVSYFFENTGIFIFAMFFSIWNMKSQKFFNIWLRWNSVSQWKENFYVTHDWITYLTHDSCYIIFSICSVTVIFNSFMTFLFSNFPFLLPKQPRTEKLQISSAFFIFFLEGWWI